MAEDEGVVMGHCLAERPSQRPEAIEIEDGRPTLCVEQILAWADAHHAAYGVWPAVGPGTVSGVVAGAPGESWKGINHALALGLRGLPGDSSLAELLAEHRSVPLPDMGPQALAEKIWAWEQEQFPVKGPRRQHSKHRDCPSLTIASILAWADAHRATTGSWPTAHSAPVQAAPFELTWLAVYSALRKGNRGLPGGMSLVRLMAEERGFRPPLTVGRILEWADAHHAAVGTWPLTTSGKLKGVAGECWRTIDIYLRRGVRGLPGGQSLSRLLAVHRGVRWQRPAKVLSETLIVDWADAYLATHRRWPDRRCGPIDQAPGETWSAIDSALIHGRHGLSGGTSLSRLILEHRGPEARNQPPPLTLEQVRIWCDAHLAATGKWPTFRTGAVRDAPFSITWAAIDAALKRGTRGLPPGFTVAGLRPGYRKSGPLTVEQILAWADMHYSDHGRWPGRYYGAIAGAPGENWNNIDAALRVGCRGLPGGSTLSSLLLQYRKDTLGPASQSPNGHSPP